MTLTKIRYERLKTKLQNARSGLLSERPFFGILMMYLKLVAVDNIRNISTNGRCIYFNPDFIDKLSLYELKFILCHQIMHIICGDIWRDPVKAGDDYHRAYDVIANHQLIKLGWKKEYLHHLGKLQYNLPHCPYAVDDMSVDEIFNEFPFRLYMLDERTRRQYMADSDLWWENKKDKGENGIIILDVPEMTKWSDGPETDEKGNDGNEGMGSSKAKEADEDNDGMGIGEKMEEFWKEKVKEAKQASDIIDKSSAAGNIPDSIKRAIKEEKKSKLDWRKMLDDFVQEEINDYSFSPPDRRFADYDFFLPDFNENDFAPKDILFMADTSGSINREDLEIAYAEISGAIEQFGNKLCGKLGFFDAAVTPPIPFENINELREIIPYGGGGTDFTVIFHYIKDEMQSDLPAAVVIFTDGYGPFPDERDTMGIPVLWLINNKKVEPPFGKVARILEGKSSK